MCACSDIHQHEVIRLPIKGNTGIWYFFFFFLFLYCSPLIFLNSIAMWIPSRTGQIGNSFMFVLPFSFHAIFICWSLFDYIVDTDLTKSFLSHIFLEAGGQKGCGVEDKYQLDT